MRFGPSGELPDCRAYEQVTPVDKEGAKEIFNYSAIAQGGALVGEDGEHVMLEDESVNLGSSADFGQSPYFFSRTSTSWDMKAAAVQPETGVSLPAPQVFTPNLEQFGFLSSYQTSDATESSNIEFRNGLPGGPYTTNASVPRLQAGGKLGGWVASSEDFSKLILQVEDRAVCGHATGTISGFDLYEFTGGQCRQVNVGIGTCGARIVQGGEEQGKVSSRDAVSADGSRVFFEAVPGSNCSEKFHFYMRVDGSETVDLGAYIFRGANALGSELLLEKVASEGGGEVHQMFLDHLFFWITDVVVFGAWCV